MPSNDFTENWGLNWPGRFPVARDKLALEATHHFSLEFVENCACASITDDVALLNNRLIAMMPGALEEIEWFKAAQIIKKKWVLQNCSNSLCF